MVDTPRILRRSLLLAAVCVLALMSSLGCGEEPPVQGAAPAVAPQTPANQAANRPAIDREELRREMRQIAREEIERAQTDRRAAPHERGRRPGLDRILSGEPGKAAAQAGDAARAPARLGPAPVPAGEAAVDSAATAEAKPAGVDSEKAATAGTEVVEKPVEPEMKPGATDRTLTVTELSTAVDVDRGERMPVGVSASFDGTAGPVWAFAVFKNDSTSERKVAFVWKRDGVEKHRADLRVGARAPRWRTWSKKNMGPKNAGSWTIEIQDESGLPLASRAFEVK